MVEDRIGYRYAKSIYALAQEKGVLEGVKEDMALVADVCKSSRDFYTMLQSPIVTSFKKEAVISRIFDAQLKSEITGNFMKLLVRKGREMYLPQAAEAFIQLFDSRHDIQRGALISAEPLPAAVVSDIVRTMEAKTGKRLDIQTKTDPALIGGFVLKLGNRLYDGSVSYALRRLKRELAKR